MTATDEVMTSVAAMHMDGMYMKYSSIQCHMTGVMNFEDGIYLLAFFKTNVKSGDLHCILFFRHKNGSVTSKVMI